MELEKECGITIPTQVERIKTVGDIIGLSASSQSAYSEKETVDYSQFPADRTIRYEKKLLSLIKLLGKLYDINIENEKHLPTETNCIISSNHCSYLDPLFVLYALGEKYIRNTRFATLAAIHTWRENKDFFNMLGGIPVVREGNTLPAIKCVDNCLDNGYDVIVFPEGARSRDGSMLPFKNGTAQMAINSNVPIVPIYIDGTFKVLPRHRKYAQLYDYKNRCRIRVNIRFGDPIYPAEHTAESLTKELRNRLEIMGSEYRI